METRGNQHEKQVRRDDHLGRLPLTLTASALSTTVRSRKPLARSGHALMGQQELASDQAVRESVCIEEIAGLSL